MIRNLTNIKDLFAAKLARENMAGLAISAHICKLFDDFISEKFPDYNIRARFYKDETIYFSGNSIIEAQKALLYTGEIILYLKSKCNGVKEVKLQIVSQRD